MGSDLRCTTDFMLLSMIPLRQSHISCRVMEGCRELKSCLQCGQALAPARPPPTSMSTLLFSLMLEVGETQ